MEFVEIQEEKYFGAGCFSQRYPTFEDVMDARNNEHENLELGAIFCQADISTHFSEKRWVFFLRNILVKVQLLLKLFYCDLCESQNYST